MPENPGAKFRGFLWAEFLLIFGGVPLLILHERKAGILFLALWVGGLIAYRMSRVAPPGPPPDLRTILRRLSLIAPFGIGVLLMVVTAQHGQHDPEKRRILLRFLILGLLLAAAVRYLLPADFLNLPRRAPVAWAAIMLLYPLLSIWPQEVIYRRFLRQRYAALFGEGNGFVAASALAFGFAHIIFLNWIALALCTIGGAMFASNYRRNGRLGLTCMEHSLYGCLVFTIGLGRFFYTGAAWHH